MSPKSMMALTCLAVKDMAPGSKSKFLPRSPIEVGLEMTKHKA